MSTLEVRGLEVSFGALQAVRGVDLEIGTGEVLALIGESGCGKSTVARAVMRLVEPSAGQILLDGRPAHAQPDFRRRVQMVFQDPFGSLNPAHTILHHVVRPLRLSGAGRDAPERAIQLLEAVGLYPAADLGQRFPHALSGGQRQRVAIARAIAVEPQILVADEPTSALDMSIRAGILGLLEEQVRARGLAMLWITHDLGSARAIADRVAVMFAGKVVEEGPTDVVLDDPVHPYTHELVSAAKRLDLAIEESEPLDLRRPPPGCAYASRCPNRSEACRHSPPQTQPRAAHRVFCHHPRSHP